MENKTLILMRHGEAENGSPAGDFARVLTETGIAGARKAGAFLAGLGLRPQQILASPASRTSQTADLVAGQIAFNLKSIERPRRLYNPATEDFTSLIADLDVATDCVLLVSHNPGVSYAAAHFCGTFKGFEPGSVAVIEFAIESWAETGRGGGKLIHFFEP